MDNVICTVLGRKGSGKTYLVQHGILPALTKPVFILDSLGEYHNGVVFHRVNEFAEYIDNRRINKSGVYILRPLGDDMVEQWFSLMQNVQDCSVVVEEASLYCKPSRIQDGFKWILNYGRHRRINLIAIARRAAELHRDITAQSDCVVSFQQTEKRDIATLKSKADVAEHLNTLDQKKYEFMVLGETPKMLLSALDCKENMTSVKNS